jgi:hypothetical protein
VRIKWLDMPYSKSLGAYRSVGYRPSGYRGPIRMVGTKLIGFAIDEYYDGTAYELHLWNWVLYYNRRYTPEAA